LAQDLLADSGLLLHTNNTLPEALVLLYPGGILLNDIYHLSAAIKEVQQKQQQPQANFLLPGETPKPYSIGNKKNDHNITAVLYANVGTEAFQQWYNSIIASEISLVLRHMGHITTSNTSSSSSLDKAHKTFLQGYGVSLDIRNIEYTVFDSKVDQDHSNKAAAATNSSIINATPDNYLQTVLHSTEYIAGINITRLLERSLATTTATAAITTTYSTSFLNLARNLLPIHHIQRHYESSAPKFMYEKRYLSLQMASAVAMSSSMTVPDPIFILKDISQNLPSRARYLQQLSTTHIREEAQYIRNNLPLLHSDGTHTKSHLPSSSSSHHSPFHVFVNGNPILRIERPSFNVFEFINIIREEQELLSSLMSDVHLPTLQAYHTLHQFIMGGEQALLSSYNHHLSGNTDVQSLHEDTPPPSFSSSLHTVRIDVGRGGSNAILYLNDIEQDARYRSWSKSLQPLLYFGSYGPPTRIRRNIFTLIIVIDPLSVSTISSSVVLLDLAVRLLQGNVPLRIGLVIVKESDVKHQWDPPKVKVTGKQVADTYQISELIYQLVHDFEQKGFFGITLSFLLSWCQHLMIIENGKNFTFRVHYVRTLFAFFFLKINIFDIFTVHPSPPPKKRNSTNCSAAGGLLFRVRLRKYSPIHGYRYQ
jgi:UDP-glucose:glycoprotein glucosyltransferase